MKNFIDETYRRWEENFAASKGSSEAIENGIKLGKPLLMSDEQLTRCLKFEKKKALIIYQSDYQVT